nr:MAG: nonstructural protein [Microvirus sp.]
MASKFLAVVAIRDRATDSFSNPVVVPHVNVGVRSFADEVKNPQSELSKHPDDFDLYHLADFNPDDGSFVPPATGKPEMVAIGKSFASS